jgi:tripartite-type tricarboxylate transporter receptor subunit TctC
VSVARGWALVAACASLAAAVAHAQRYPVKPVRLLVGFTAGSGTDVTGRLVAQKLSEQFGQSVIVENRAGAGGGIAIEAVAKSPPDGYTLLLMSSSGTALSALRPNLPYDLARDLVPVSQVATGPLILVVHPSLPVRTVKELLAFARGRPGKLSYGSSGIGSATHLAAELLCLTAKISIAHVPYKGTADSVVATAAGQIEMSFNSVTGVLALLEAGRLRGLALTSATRSSLLPAIPTLAESGFPGYDRATWYGVLAPAGVAKEIVARLNGLIGEGVNTAEMRQALNQQGFEPKTGTPEQFATLIQAAIAQDAKLIKASGVKPD